MQIIEGENTIEAPSRQAWRDWLMQYHAVEKSIWLIIYHKKSGVPTVYYPEAVNEAICFGWIDAVKRKRDAQSAYQYFAVRKPKSNWSRVNKEKVAQLTAAGLIHPAGQRMIDLAKETGTWHALNEVDELIVPQDLTQALAAYPGAQTNFEAFPRSARRGILEWILNAKQPETRARRVLQTAEKAAQNIKANFPPKLQS